MDNAVAVVLLVVNWCDAFRLQRLARPSSVSSMWGLWHTRPDGGSVWSQEWLTYLTGLRDSERAARTSVSNHPWTEAPGSSVGDCWDFWKRVPHPPCVLFTELPRPSGSLWHGDIYLVAFGRFISCRVSKPDVSSLQYRGSFEKSLYSVPAKYLILLTSPVSHV